MLGLLLHIYLGIFCFSLLCFLFYLRFWWCRKKRKTCKSNSYQLAREYSNRKYKYSKGVDVESSISSVQGTTMLIVHNTPMGFISEDLDEDSRRFSMNSNNASLLLFPLPSPGKNSESERKMIDVLWDKCVPNKKHLCKLPQDIVIRVEDYDEIQNATEEVINLKGNLDLPIGEEPNLMEDKPMPNTGTKFSIQNLRSKDSEVLV